MENFNFNTYIKKECPYCGKTICGKFSEYTNHIKNCSLNPHINEIKSKIKKSISKTIKEKNPIIKYNFICEKCGSCFTKELKESTYNSLLKRNKLPRFCCKSCANGHIHSDETKRKISQSLIKHSDETKSIKPQKVQTTQTIRKNKKVYKKLKHQKSFNVQYSKYIEKCDITSIVDCKDCYFFQKQLCKKSGTMKQKIKHIHKWFDIDMSKMGSVEIIKEFENIYNTLYDLYINQRKSSTEIDEMLNIKRSDNILFKTLNIPRRTIGESLVNAHINGRFNYETFSPSSFKAEYHKTWNDKIYLLRSSYETEYANKLDELQIDYEVESLRVPYYDTIKHKTRCAIPDFYIPETNTIIEIKSNYTLIVQEMIDKKKAYEELGYKFKLILDHKEVDINHIIQSTKYFKKTKQTIN